MGNIFVFWPNFIIFVKSERPTVTYLQVTRRPSWSRNVLL